MAWTTFQSCSTSVLDLPLAFEDDVTGGTYIVLETRTAAGIKSLSRFGNIETEFIVVPGTCFQVVSNVTVGPITMIRLREAVAV